TPKSPKFADAVPRCAPRSLAKASICPMKSRPCSTSWKPNGSSRTRPPLGSSREAPREGARRRVKPHPYCYPDTNVYRNKFDIRDAKELEDLERDLSAYRLLTLPDVAPIT